MVAACTLRAADSLDHLPPALQQIARWEWAGAAPEQIDRPVADLMTQPPSQSSRTAPSR